MQQIMECSGSQFDPALVEAFVEMMKERGNTAA
jgi:response regulator RpfG family c-di-GMP phosphodiesterase